MQKKGDCVAPIFQAKKTYLPTKSAFSILTFTWAQIMTIITNKKTDEIFDLSVLYVKTFNYVKKYFCLT